MTSNEVLGIIRRQWVVLLVCLVLGGGAATVYAYMQPTTYIASARLYVTMSNGTSVTDSYQGGMAAQQRIASYATLATGPEVAQRVHDQLRLNVGPEMVQGTISASFPPATSLLDVAVTDRTADGARVGANAVAAELVKMVADIETIQEGAPPAARLRIVEEARTPLVPSGPAVTKIIGLGLAIGLVVGWLAAVARDRMRKRSQPHRVQRKRRLVRPRVWEYESAPPARDRERSDRGQNQLAEASSRHGESNVSTQAVPLNPEREVYDVSENGRSNGTYETNP